MKSELFQKAIQNRNRINFYYDTKEVTLEPYYIGLNHSGKKVVFGRVISTSQIKMFEFEKIFNIKLIAKPQFSPIIPLMAMVN